MLHRLYYGVRNYNIDVMLLSICTKLRAYLLEFIISSPRAQRNELPGNLIEALCCGSLAHIAITWGQCLLCKNFIVYIQ